MEPRLVNERAGRSRRSAKGNALAGAEGAAMQIPTACTLISLPPISGIMLADSVLLISAACPPVEELGMPARARPGSTRDANPESFLGSRFGGIVLSSEYKREDLELQMLSSWSGYTDMDRGIFPAVRFRSH